MANEQPCTILYQTVCLWLRGVEDIWPSARPYLLVALFAVVAREDVFLFGPKQLSEESPSDMSISAHTAGLLANRRL